MPHREAGAATSSTAVPALPAAPCTSTDSLLFACADELVAWLKGGLGRPRYVLARI
jgi:hypothetical protein